ncbi:MAG: diguanylate cyclase [Gemmatimonadetes bacterium]|nr:diguanylate cyclase [Gemmatimonadota bacterium]
MCLGGATGGDEFGLLFCGIADADEIQTLTEEVIRRVARSYSIRGRVTIGASIGMACGPEDGDTVDELIHNADLALYRSRTAGVAPSRVTAG